ncbi:MAG TPA: type II toxin-antitoxin system RelE/ParE family toxin [Vicinamibacteria bacterium]|nr:type II toxin-antitoxin system RelE/ParE family toxin [Vicinamibacteria bacterium]
MRAFPSQARRNAGFQLRRVQQGLQPHDWKWMPTVGNGVQEIRIHAGTEHRVFYVARFAEGIYVLHAFEKRTSKTPKRNIEQGRNRYRDLLRERRKEGYGET